MCGRMCWLAALALTCLSPGSGYRLLGFHPWPGRSQQDIFAAVHFTLASRGHQVVYVTPVPPQLTHPNLEVRLIRPLKVFKDTAEMEAKGKASIPGGENILYGAVERGAETLYGHPVVQELVHSNETFDAVILESYFYQEPASALLHKFSCPAIEISTLGESSWLNELSGLPDNPSYQIDWDALTTDELPTLWSRLYNTYITWSTVAVSYYHLIWQEKIMNQYFNYTGWEERPRLASLLSNRSLILVNKDILLSYPYPKAPHVKNVGGLNILPNKPLPKDLQKFLDKKSSSSSNVVLVSLGSNLKTSDVLGARMGEVFFKVFAQLPMVGKVLMKWENEESIPNNLSDKYLTYKWIPQQDVLAHKDMALFITHGGYLSLTEAVYHGVPVLGIPFFGDQPKNLIQAEAAGYGLWLSPDNVTLESMSWALNELLTNSRYRQEARRRSAIMRSRRTTPLEEAAYWIEHAIKYPNSMTPRSAFLNFFQVHLIDVYLVLGVFLCLIFCTIRSVFAALLPRKGPQPRISVKKVKKT